MKQLRILFLLLCVGLLAGCTQKAHPANAFAPDESQRLVIYTSHKQNVYQPIIREFEERTGIWVEVITGGTLELLEQLQDKEQSNADVFFGGGADSLEAFSDCFQSFESPLFDRIPEEYRSASNRWVPFSVLPVVLIYNTKLVDPEHLTGWQDLFRPEFNGQIAFANPEKSGSCFTALSTFRLAAGEEGLASLAQSLNGIQAESSGTIPTSVASGEHLVGITLEETALGQIQDGANLGIVYPADGTSCVPDGTAIIRNAPHMENATKFLEFTLSRDVQELLQTQLNRRSVWADIAESSKLPPLDTLNALPYDIHAAASVRSMLLREWSSARKEAAR